MEIDFLSRFVTETPGWFVNIKVRKLHPIAKLPEYKTPGAAGMDLFALIHHDDPEKTYNTLILPGQHRVIGSGLAFEIPPNFEAQVRPRSGLAANDGITVLNSPGTIDSDYRGEVGVIVINHGDRPFRVRTGDRIAQVVIAPVFRAQFQVVEELGETDRGAGGLGSTGV